MTYNETDRVPNFLSSIGFHREEEGWKREVERGGTSMVVNGQRIERRQVIKILVKEMGEGEEETVGSMEKRKLWGYNVRIGKDDVGDIWDNSEEGLKIMFRQIGLM